jgi:hypothetical protein
MTVAAGVIGLKRLYQSIFIDTEATPYISTNDMITIIGDSDDLLIDPIAGFIDGDCLYLQLQLTTLNENHLPDRLLIIENNYIVNIGDVNISRIDKTSVIVEFKSEINYFNNNGEAIVKFNAISSEPITVDGFITDESPPIPEDGIIDRINYDNAITYYGNWEVFVSADSIIEPEYINSIFKGLTTITRVNATSIEVKIFAEEDTPYDLSNIDNRLPIVFEEDNYLLIMLLDGSVINPVLNGSVIDFYVISYSYDMEFIQPANVVEIMFDGEVLFKRAEP